MTYTSIGTSGNSDQLGSYAPYLYRNLNGSTYTGNGNGGETGRPRVGGGMEVHEQSGECLHLTLTLTLLCSLLCLSLMATCIWW